MPATYYVCDVVTDAGVLIKIGFEHFTNFGVRYSAQAGLYTFVGSGAFVLIGGSSHSVMNCQVDE